MSEPVDDIDCQDLVELVTAYLDDVLDAHERARIDQHLDACPGCATVVAQWRSVIAMAGRLDASDAERLDPAVRGRLVDAFRRGGDS